MTAKPLRWLILIALFGTFLVAGCGPGPAPAKPSAGPTPTLIPLQRPAGSGGGVIVFASDRSGNNMDLFLINADGSELTQLTDTARDIIAPAWSPDGSRIAALVHFNDQLTLHLLELDPFPAAPVSVTRQLSELAADESTPSWSPDGAWITLSAAVEGNQELFLVPADGGKAVQLTDSEANEIDPAWSPDGERIAYISDLSGEYQLYLADRTGENAFDFSAPVPLAGIPGEPSQPCWSPAGNRLAFFLSQSGQKDIYLIDTDGSGLARVTDSPADEWNPRWSPDGERLLYSYFNFDAALNDLSLLDPGTQEQIPITADQFDNWWPDITR